ncbi:MAG: tetratricopeptide repeat protein [Bacteroidales bacterium]|nr:tetratricopeptide repeat protein [Bacteroidales bacterium]
MIIFNRNILNASRVKDFLRSTVLCMCIFLVFQLPAQNQGESETLDSLAYIADTSFREAKVDAMLVLESSAHLIGSNKYTRSAIQICTEALSISQEIGYIIGEARANHRLAYLNNNFGLFRNALNYSRRLIYLSSDLDSHNIMGAYMQFSISYRGLEMYDSAYYYGMESLRIAKIIGDCSVVANRNLNMAKLYSQIGDHEAELQAYLDGYAALKYCTDTNLRDGYVTYSRSLGYYYLTHGNYREALKYFSEADSIYGNLDLVLIRVKGYHARQASNIARVYQHWGKLDSAMKYRRLALKRFTDYGFPEKNINIPNQYCYIGMIYREQGDFELAREYLEKSLELRKCNGDSLGVGMSLDEIAVLARMMGRYQEAVLLLQESLQWKTCVRSSRIDPSRRAQKIESQSETYLLLGQVFADWNKFNDALLYYDTAIMLNRQVAYKRGEAQLEYYRGIAWQQKGKQDTAFKYLQRSLELSESMQNKSLIAKALTGLARLYVMQGKLPEALEHLEIALNIYLEEGFTRELPEVYLDLGRARILRGERTAALDALQKAFDGAASMGMIAIQADATFELAALYDEKGDLNLSNKYLKDYILLHDSVFTLETHKQLAEMQALHEAQQRTRQISQLEQENQLKELNVKQSRYIIIILGGIVIIIIIFAILFLRQANIRNEQKALLNQQQLFRSQMNPHFIFNSLTNIQHYIFQKDPLSAGKYLALFAKLMRNILNNSRLESISLKNELETISQYLELQQLRMEDKLEYEIDVDEALDAEITAIPPMLAQPFIENAIEHGIRNKEGSGKVSVRIRKDEDCIVYEIKDDGVGRKKVAEIQEDKKKDHKSMAVSLTRSRLQSLWGRKKPEKVLEILDLEDSEGNPSGTLVRFRVPNS